MSSSGLKNCPASRDWIGLPLLASFKGEIWHEVHEADLVFCDSIASEQVKHPRSFAYRLIAPSSLEYVTTAMESYQKV